MDAAHQLLGRHEILVELIVQIVTVHLHQNRRVQPRPAAQDAGEKNHRQTLARPLRMPDDPHPLVSFRAHRSHGFGRSQTHGEELVIFGRFFCNLLVDHFVHDEIAHVIE